MSHHRLRISTNILQLLKTPKFSTSPPCDNFSMIWKSTLHRWSSPDNWPNLLERLTSQKSLEAHWTWHFTKLFPIAFMIAYFSKSSRPSREMSCQQKIWNCWSTLSTKSSWLSSPPRGPATSMNQCLPSTRHQMLAPLSHTAPNMISYLAHKSDIKMRTVYNNKSIRPSSNVKLNITSLKL